MGDLMTRNQRLRRILTALLAALMLMTACAPAALATSFKATINSSSARVYSSPSTSSKYSLPALKNATVTVTGYAGGWARISYKGNTGYMQIKYLNLTSRIKAYAAKSSNVYKSASSSSSRLGTIPRGCAVYVIGVSGDYCRIQNRSGSVTGYVKSDNLATRSEIEAAYQAWKKAQSASGSSGSATGSSSGGSSSGSSSSESSVSKIDKVLALAVSLIGRPYALDDDPPSSFNCSSFVEYCMEKYGYSMQGTAASQAGDGRYSKVTSGYQKGDVLCFDTDGDGVCDHTAIYMGNNAFIEASQNAGKVQTNSLTDWYKGHLLWARRPS